MNEAARISFPVLLLVAFLAGMGLALIYFRLLWATVKRLCSVRRPLMFVAGSFIARMLMLLSGFYLVMAGQWERLVACLLGFLLMREIYVRRLWRGAVKAEAPRHQ